MQGGNWLRYGKEHLAWNEVPVQAFGAVGGGCKRWPVDCSPACTAECSGNQSIAAASAVTAA
jgi:hypothetical protein